MIDRLPQAPGASSGAIDPRTAYGSPQEIRDAEGLSEVEKEQLLARWADYSEKSAKSDAREADEARDIHAKRHAEAEIPDDAS